jgi:hypothetical protein
MNSIDAASWMSANAQVDMLAETSEDGLCKVASAKLRPQTGKGDVTIMFVQDTRSAYLKESAVVAEWITHVTAVHGERIGTQRGWDR